MCDEGSTGRDRFSLKFCIWLTSAWRLILGVSIGGIEIEFHFGGDRAAFIFAENFCSTRLAGGGTFWSLDTR